MEDKQRPLKSATGKMKDILNTYMRGDEASDAPNPEPVVPASTSTDINEVHAHAEAAKTDADRTVDESSVIIGAPDLSKSSTICMPLWKRVAKARTMPPW
jgi:hypothetical protein